jgi:hypothetical protein
MAGVATGPEPGISGRLERLREIGVAHVPCGLREQELPAGLQRARGLSEEATDVGQLVDYRKGEHEVHASPEVGSVHAGDIGKPGLDTVPQAGPSRSATQALEYTGLDVYGNDASLCPD